jgi:hypothetical protein
MSTGRERAMEWLTGGRRIEATWRLGAGMVLPVALMFGGFWANSSAGLVFVLTLVVGLTMPRTCTRAGPAEGGGRPVLPGPQLTRVFARMLAIQLLPALHSSPAGWY